MTHNYVPAISDVLADPAASQWLKDALRTALARDAVDAANDASYLFAVLDKRAYEAIQAAQVALGAAAAPPVER